MIRPILLFLLMWAVCIYGFREWRLWTGKDVWSFTKTAVYGGVCATIVVAVLSFIVIVF